MDYQLTTVDQLIPYASNSRTHSDEQITQIAASIKEFGFLNPVLVDSEGVIIAGHGRVMAAKKLGLESVPTVLVSHLTEAQKKAYIIADNQLALNAGWDLDLLKVEIEGLQELDFDVGLLGFEDDFIDGLLDEPTEGLTDDDHVPEAPEEPITKKGDLWILGNHRLLCGDSTNIQDVDKVTNNNYVKMVFTDIPYNISQKSNGLRNIDYGEWDKNVENIGIEISSMDKGESAYLFCGDEQLSGILKTLKNNDRSTRTFVWKKKNPNVMNGEKIWLPSQELCAFGKKKGGTFNGKCVHAFWEGAPDTNRVHPNQKPVEMVSICIKASSNEGDVVLDYFGGSGTTLIASEKTNRTCFIIEKETIYCDVIIKRWQEYTGQDAILESTGETYNQLAGAA